MSVSGIDFASVVVSILLL